MNKQNIIIAVLLGILIAVCGVGLYIWTSHSNGSSHPSNDLVDGTAGNKLPDACYDKNTTDLIKQLIKSTAARNTNDQLVKDLIYETEITLSNIGVLYEATEEHPVHTCEADIDLKFPYLTTEQQAAMDSSLITGLYARGKHEYIRVIKNKANFTSQFTYDEEGNKDQSVDLYGTEAYAYIVLTIALEGAKHGARASN